MDDMGEKVEHCVEVELLEQELEHIHSYSYVTTVDGPGNRYHTFFRTRPLRPFYDVQEEENKDGRYGSSGKLLRTEWHLYLQLYCCCGRLLR